MAERHLIRPRRTAEKHWKGKEQPLVEKQQDGEVDQGERRDWGDLPNSGQMMPNAGSEEAAHGGATTRFGKAPSKKAKGSGEKTSHSAGPKYPPGQHTGGKTDHGPEGHEPPGQTADTSTGHAKAASLDTMTRLLFHPGGGMGHTTSPTHARDSGGFKDSGHRSETPEIAKREVHITRGRAKHKVAR